MKSFFRSLKLKSKSLKKESRLWTLGSCRKNLMKQSVLLVSEMSTSVKKLTEKCAKRAKLSLSLTGRDAKVDIKLQEAKVLKL